MREEGEEEEEEGREEEEARGKRCGNGVRRRR